MSIQNKFNPGCRCCGCQFCPGYVSSATPAADRWLLTISGAVGGCSVANGAHTLGFWFTATSPSGKINVYQKVFSFQAIWIAEITCFEFAGFFARLWSFGTFGTPRWAMERQITSPSSCSQRWNPTVGFGVQSCDVSGITWSLVRI